MTEDNARELAQLEQRDAPKKHGEGVPVLFYAEVVGALDLSRGYATRAQRPATWADVEALGSTLEGWPGSDAHSETI